MTNEPMTPEEVRQLVEETRIAVPSFYEMRIDEAGLVCHLLAVYPSQYEVVWTLDKDGLRLGPAYGNKLITDD